MPTTFVDDAELIWSEIDADKTQAEIAEIMGWDGDGARVRVAQYKALRKIKTIAWQVIVTTFGALVNSTDDSDVTESVTSVTSPFTEGLLRSILDIRAPQQVELVTKLATDKELLQLSTWL